MLNCLSSDSKMQLRLNIKRHRQKLLQYLENTNDTVLKPKIKLVSNDIEKSNLNHNVKPKIASNTEVETPKFIPTIKITSYRNKPTIHVKTYEAVINTEPNNPEVLTDNNIKKYQTRSSITENQLPPNIKANIQDEVLTDNNIKKYQTRSSITENQLPPNIKVNIQDEVLTDNNINNNVKKYQTRSSITVNQLPPNIKVNIQDEVLTDNNINNNVKKYQTRSSINVNQLPPNIKVNIQDEPLSNFQLKPKPLPIIEIKDPEPPTSMIKKLKEQLIEELFDDSSSSEEIDDNISVGNNDDWNEIYQIHNGSDVDENDSSNLRLMEVDGHKQLANDISKEKCKYL